MSRKQIILGAYLGGVNHHTAWWHPRAGSQIDFTTFTLPKASITVIVGKLGGQ